MRIASSRHTRSISAFFALGASWYGCDIGTDDDGEGGSTSLVATTTASTASCIGEACGDIDAGGGGSIAGFCIGMASPCESFANSSTCFDVPGCEAFTECSGTVVDCPLLTQAQCGGQLGCYWSYVVDGPAFCAGTAATCPEIGSSACESQQGCQVDVACSGTALPCEALASPAVCALQMGCSWQ